VKISSSVLSFFRNFKNIGDRIGWAATVLAILAQLVEAILSARGDGGRAQREDDQDPFE